MSYVDAFYNKDLNQIDVVERIDGKRVYKRFPVEHVFYYEDIGGKYQSIYGTPASKVVTRSQRSFRKELAIHSNKKIFESDVNVVFKCLSENYLNAEPPNLHLAFLDIEVNFHQTKGFASSSDPFNEITSISVYLSWINQLITLALPPSHLSMDTANDLVAEFDNTILFDSEKDLLNTFIEILDDVDVISGWNSEGYDIPYIVNRIIRVLSKKDINRLCLWNQSPTTRTYERYGTEESTYDLIGRVHMDYLQLYRKFTYEERHSYSLDAIGDYELGERKVTYSGTLDQLYTQDFKKFIEYNRMDAMLVAKLDKKLKFIDLSNTLAHDATVLLPTTLGSVAMIEQAVINEAHRRNLIVPNKTHHASDDTKAVGAYVADPVKGIHEYIGSIDINSLYPSTIRALNMGQETIIGQLRPILTEPYIAQRVIEKGSTAAAWEGIFASLEYTAVMEQQSTKLILDWEDGESIELPASDVWKLIFASNVPWCLSANGTIFTFEKEAIVPGLLNRWYAERKQLQKKLKEVVEANGTKEEQEYWDKRQLVKKIVLNSTYGAILNAHCRFFDKRIGQSTTLTGRSICKFMAASINQIVDNEFDHHGRSIIAGDTDSAYFSVWPIIKDEVKNNRIEWDKDIAIALYDSIAEQVNHGFPSFMEQAFHCPRSHGSLIKGGREIIASRGIFIAKKRYAVLYYDKEGFRYDTNGKHGSLKAMGLDLKRADTPKFVQDFLKEILFDLLTNNPQEYIIDKIIDFKTKVKAMKPWEKGTPKRVNKLTKFTAKYEKDHNTNLPGHVRAAINWNTLRTMHNDNHAMRIYDGQKTIVCKLKPNMLEWTSIGYPIDELHLPQWFLDLPFDNELMEKTIIDQKIDNLLGVLNWDIREHTNISNTFNDLFSM